MHSSVYLKYFRVDRDRYMHISCQRGGGAKAAKHIKANPFYVPIKDCKKKLSFSINALL